MPITILAVTSIFLIALWAGKKISKSRKRRASVNNFCSNFPSSNDDPLMQDAVLSNGWSRTLGEIDGRPVKLLLKASAKGLTLLFFARARKPPIIIEWNRVLSVKSQQVDPKNGVLTFRFHDAVHEVRLGATESLLEEAPSSLPVFRIKQP